MAIRSIKQRIRRFFKSATWENIQIGMYMIILLISSPVSIPIACLLGWFDERRKKQAVDRFSCTNCDNILGKSALKLASKEWNTFTSQSRAEHPELRINFENRPFDAICVSCGTRFTYSEKVNKFRLVSETIAE